MGTGRSFSEGKARPGREADHSPLLLQGLWMSRSSTTCPPFAKIDALWDFFTFYVYNTRMDAFNKLLLNWSKSMCLFTRKWLCSSIWFSWNELSF
jgi:hypothetical protein